MHKHTVIVIEDDDGIRELIRSTLPSNEYDVICAADGMEGLAVVRQYEPALIILDMHMPVLDGWGFLRAYETLPGRTAPVIAMSADVKDPRTVRHVEGFLVKPFNIDYLLSLVRGVLGRYASVH
jgi:two-component system chemotaxis response regulator CheY